MAVLNCKSFKVAILKRKALYVGNKKVVGNKSQNSNFSQDGLNDRCNFFN